MIDVEYLPDHNVESRDECEFCTVYNSITLTATLNTLNVNSILIHWVIDSVQLHKHVFKSVIGTSSTQGLFEHSEHMEWKPCRNVE